MNLGQYRVLSALLRLPVEFTTTDIVREAGVSAEVVRKTYQRNAGLFVVVRNEIPKIRSLGKGGRAELKRKLYEGRSQLPAPPRSIGNRGEPLGLLAAERIIYELVPVSQEEERALLLREARSHLLFAEQESALDLLEDNSLSIAQTAAVETRLEAVRRILGLVDVLHNARAVMLEKGLIQNDLSVIAELTNSLLNAQLAQKRASDTPASARVPVESRGNTAKKSLDKGIAHSVRLRHSPAINEAELSSAMLGLAKERAWQKALGVQSLDLIVEKQLDHVVASGIAHVHLTRNDATTKRVFRSSGRELEDPVVIVGAARTPMGGMLGDFANVTATHLGGVVIRAALERSKIQVEDVGEVLMGCCLFAGLKQAPARQAAHFAGLPWNAGATTLSKMCGSAMKTVMLGHDNLLVGSHDVVVAGGMESMSNAPYLVLKGRTGYRLGHGDQLKDHMFYDGLEDAYEEGRAMGTFAEDCAEMYQFTREAQDNFAIASVTRAQAASKAGVFEAEIAPVTIKDRKGERTVSADQAPFQVNVNNIPILKAAFRKNGTVTAATSSSISDGAAALVLMKRSEAEKRGLTPLAMIHAHATHSQEPHLFTMAPIGAIRKVLEKSGWTNKDVDLWEINEAFAVVTMAAMRDIDIPHDKLNINGGACALGHPIGASGARIIVTLLHALEKQGLKKGVAGICIGGGEATAMSIERLT